MYDYLNTLTGTSERMRRSDHSFEVPQKAQFWFEQLYSILPTEKVMIYYTRFFALVPTEVLPQRFSVTQYIFCT